MKKLTFSKILFSASLALMGITTQALDHENLLKRIFGATAEHPNRNKLENGSISGDNRLERLEAFLTEIDCPEVARRAGTKKDKNTLCQAAQEFKLEQLDRIFIPLPENIDSFPDQSFWLTQSEREQLVKEITLPAFMSMTNLDEKGVGIVLNPLDLTQKPNQYSIKVPQHQIDPSAGNHNPPAEFTKKSEFSIPKMIAGSLVGAGLVWYLYQNWFAEKDETTSAA